METSARANYRSVLVTGGTRGIGQAAVYAFAHAGYRVAFSYQRSNETADDMVRSLQSEGKMVCAFRCDQASVEDLEQLYAQTKRVFGTIDSLVLNAGIARRALLVDETANDMAHVLQVNLMGAMHLCRLYTPDMVRRGFGRVVAISSVFAQSGAAMESVYAASKGGVEAFAKSLDKELSPAGVRVHIVAPGLVDTDMNRSLTTAERAAFLHETAQPAITTPAQVAAEILELCSA